ncbi:hypothetical protein GOBAR_DD31393 [Gossypium barbadense]|nr:hypothetical protein GOBAR_DD31393 [Gossypium barbadense]
MDYRRSIIVKRRGGSSELQIVEDVTTRSRSGHGLDIIVLKRNNGRLRKTNDEKCPWRWCGGCVKPEGDVGGRRRIGMNLNGQDTYHRLVYYQMLLPSSITSKGCRQRQIWELFSFLVF